MACPAPAGTRLGNRVTAERWARILRGFGHTVRIASGYRGEPADLLVALHARRSAPAVRAFRTHAPGRPIVVALTGTDLYRDLPRSAAARRSLGAADRLVVLQRAARERLAPAARRKARVILQSVALPAGIRRPRRRSSAFEVCVIAHLRHVKDPLRVARAVRRLPPGSQLRVVHLGRALDARWAARARAEQRRNPRYRWLGERTRPAVLRRLAASRLLVVASRLEGGANAVGEAAVLGVPILASDIPGNVGLLGRRHPGLFPVGDTRALRALLLRAEGDAAFLARLARASRRLAPRFQPARERRAWQRLLPELGLG